MASPGNLQSGLSRKLFDKWCTDKKNTCIIPSYAIEGSLSKTIMNEPREVTLANGLTAPLHMQIFYISFSAHADFPHTSCFLDELRPPNIILVHGEANEMGRLKQKLITQFDGTNTKIMSPKNCQSVEMYFCSEKMGKTVGRLAEKVPEVEESVSGLLMKKGFTYQIMAPEDLRVYTQLSTANITQKIAVPYSGSFEVIKYRLKQIYESVEPSTEEPDVRTLIVHERVTIRLDSESYVTLEWSSDPISDMVCDSVVAMVLNIGRVGPKVVPVEEASKTEEETEKVACRCVYALMVSLFVDVKVAEEGKLFITMDGDVACLNGSSGDVECDNAALKEKIKTAFRRIQVTVRPIPLSTS